YDASWCPNAGWTGSQMIYCDGFPQADDVVAHELTHGVTDYESNLYYYMQSGAISEAFSDIWGEFVDLTNGAGNDDPGVRWQMGEDLPIGAIRDMSDPTLFGDPDRMTSANYYCGSLDEGGVHTNSGVANKAAYLMVDGETFNGITVTGMGISKTADVWYEVQTNLMTSAGDYADLYDYLQQAAINLGYSSADRQTVTDAVDATEMNQLPACPALQAPLCATGPPYNLWVDDLESTGSGNWTSAAISGSDEWYYPQIPNSYSYPATYATSGIYNFWGYDQGARADYYIAMTSDITLPSGAYLHFNHAYRFESGAWDGGVLEYSTDGGATWNDTSGLFTHNGYNGTIRATGPPDNRSPLAGRSAFVNFSNGYISSRLDLSSLAGQSVRFRFRIGTDVAAWDYGWFIDDIRIYICGTATTTSSNDSGNEKNQFVPGETVYVKGSGLHPNRTYKLWIQDDPVSEEELLSAGEDPSGAQETVTTGPDNGNDSGGFPATAIWAIPSDLPVTNAQYDIVADKQSDAGNTGRYNAASDGIDSATVVGIVAPIPEPSTFVLLGIGLAALTAYFVLRRLRQLSKRSALAL
ncbi:MAG: M4 family metallopeptidase, partial [Dehalococcoidales bacterium]